MPSQGKDKNKRDEQRYGISALRSFSPERGIKHSTTSSNSKKAG